jgi:hypothetical protein
MLKLRSIAGALTVVAVVFSVPVFATLLAGQIGLPQRVVGWITLLLMCVLAYFLRPMLKRLLLRKPEITQAEPRRSHNSF